MRCQEISRYQEGDSLLSGKSLLLDKTFFGESLKIWFLIMELTFPIGMDK